MKKLFVSLLCLALISVVFSQQQRDRNYYLQKSKHQKTAAFILAGGGAVLIATGLLIDKGAYTGQNPYTLWTTSTHKNDGIKSAFSAAGVVTMLCSIPFFIASSRNNQKAMKIKVSLNNQKIVFPQPNGFVIKTQPSLNLKIGL